MRTHPRRKVLGIVREILFLLPHPTLIIKDQDRPLPIPKPIDPGLGRLVILFFGQHGFEDIGGDIPELVVFITKENDGSADLVVAVTHIAGFHFKCGRRDSMKSYLANSQRRRSMQDGLLDDLLDPVFRDAGLVAQMVDRSSKLDGFEVGVGRGGGGG